MSKLKAVLFDMDGVLLDSEPLHDKIAILVLQQFGIEANHDILNKYVGSSSKVMWEDLVVRFSLPSTSEELLDLYWKTIIDELKISGIQASEGILVLLENLRASKIVTAVASSSRRDFILAVMDYIGIAGYMDEIVDGFSIKNGKPAPDIYLEAARRLGVKSDECLVIEDSTNGINAGKNAGMKVVGYDNPTSLGQSMERADYVVKRLVQVVDIIQEL